MTTKQQNQIKIDLSKLTYAPHPKVEEAFVTAGAEHLHWKHNPSYVNEERLRLCSAASGKPIKYYIQSLYRRALSGNREYLLFHMAANTVDFYGNIVQHFFSSCGRIEVPVIAKSYGIPQGRRLVSNTDVTKMQKAEELEVSVDHFEEIWEWPFEQTIDQLQEWRNKGIVDEHTRLYAWQGTSKYGVNSWERFIGLPMNDLVLVSRVGDRFAGLLAGQELTPVILEKLREKLTQETITAINTADKKQQQ